mmetsp:Transcript_19483/g.48846  ORF Transcript_19483/g.48846 Transcript_19483/m.48846 type:complete len:316 (-) Transcript_19483:5907-6854(-)
MNQRYCRVVVFFGCFALAFTASQLAIRRDGQEQIVRSESVLVCTMLLVTCQLSIENGDVGRWLLRYHVVGEVECFALGKRSWLEPGAQVPDDLRLARLFVNRSLPSDIRRFLAFLQVDVVAAASRPPAPTDQIRQEPQREKTSDTQNHRRLPPAAVLLAHWAQNLERAARPLLAVPHRHVCDSRRAFGVEGLRTHVAVKRARLRTRATNVRARGPRIVHPPVFLREQRYGFGSSRHRRRDRGCGHGKHRREALRERGTETARRIAPSSGVGTVCAGVGHTRLHQTCLGGSIGALQLDLEVELEGGRRGQAATRRS